MESLSALYGFLTDVFVPKVFRLKHQRAFLQEVVLSHRLKPNILQLIKLRLLNLALALHLQICSAPVQSLE